MELGWKSDADKLRYLLVGAATAMRTVAIWSMHFIGNRAITMEADQPELQIGYNPGFMAGSFFLPICVVGIAFYLFTISEQVPSTGTIAGGCLTGFAICGMRYMGQGGISNYEAVYDWRFVVAATLSRGVFFYFRSAWTNTWWKRMACATPVCCRGVRYALDRDCRNILRAQVKFWYRPARYVKADDRGCCIMFGKVGHVSH